jgi:hypothetical protein
LVSSKENIPGVFFWVQLFVCSDACREIASDPCASRQFRHHTKLNHRRHSHRTHNHRATTAIVMRTTIKLFLTALLLLWATSTAAATIITTQQECEAVGWEWQCRCAGPPPPPPPPPEPLTLAHIIVYTVFYGPVALIIGGLAWLLRGA